MSSEVPDSSGCPKCGHGEVDVGSVSTTGGGLSKMFDVQTKKFKTVSCTSCGFTEFYRADRSRGSDLADVFLG